VRSGAAPAPVAGLSLAADVIRQDSAQTRADVELRLALRRARGLPESEARLATRAVFAYHRWRGWLGESPVTPHILRQAIALADKFRANPAAFSVAELQDKAVPPWILEHQEVTFEWLHWLQTEPALWLRVRAADVEPVREALHGWALPWRPPADLDDTLPEHLLSGLRRTCLRYEGLEDLFKSASFHAGAFEIQDIASQAVGWCCNPVAGENWWDACAGEGGKTLHLSDLMQGKGSIWASDRAAWRLDRLKRRAARASCFNYRTVLWEGGARLPTRTRFDGVLLDAPCSGVGTWQRNPHARWTIQPADVMELSALQTQLLNHVAAAVKPGGKLIYSVCTLTRAETVQVVGRFESAHPEFERWCLGRGAEAVGPIQLLPERFGGNGMFLAGWRRRAPA